MRIIITNNGKEVLHKLYSSSSCPDIFNNNNHLSDIKNKNNIFQGINQKNIDVTNNSINDDSKIPLYINSNSNLASSNRNNNLINPKIIKIKEKSLKMPISFLKKYEKKDFLNIENNTPIIKQSLSVLSNLENNKSIQSKNLNSNNNTTNIIDDINTNSRLYSGITKSGSNIILPQIKSKYSIGEIINKNCFDKLNKKIKEKIDEKKYNIKIDDKTLRKNWSYNNIFDEINKRKNKTIEASNYKLIEYLMKKTSISGNFLKKLNECNDEKLMHLNKISGKILVEKEREKNFNKKMREKLENQKIKESEDFREILFKIKKNVNSNIKDNHMNNYSLVKDSNNAVYKSVFKSFRKQYWKKSDNFSRFFPKYQNVHYEEI
jgi:hypothetical protein